MDTSLPTKVLKNFAVCTSFLDCVSKDKELLSIECTFGQVSVLVGCRGESPNGASEQARVNVNRSKWERAKDVADQGCLVARFGFGVGLAGQPGLPTRIHDTACSD
ncbi:hypothetical protein AYO40_01775 [Planctomycetaceae bacterium SCGC AG-212-D15]|nr:hypothetical protein AYO40_01775 [Planctomycetaceae bacterium SCGC AG-212-D15]